MQTIHKNQPKNDTKNAHAQENFSSLTTAVFPRIIDTLNQLLEQAEQDQFRSDVSRETLQTCLFCSHQSTCFLKESAQSFATDLVNVTESRNTINLHEPLYLFSAHYCGGFHRIEDPIIPKP